MPVDKQIKLSPPSCYPSRVLYAFNVSSIFRNSSSALIQRFSFDQIDCSAIPAIPAECIRGNVSFDSIKSAIDFYLSFLDNSLDSVPAEFLRWRSYWLRHQSESLQNDALQAMIIVEEMNSYPSLTILIQILATLPVTTATNERLFNALKYLKTYLQNATKEVRLNGSP